MGLVALAVSAVVERDDSVVCGEVWEDARLDLTGVEIPREPVEEDHWRARSLVNVMDAHPVRVEKLVLSGHEVECEEVEGEEA
jgi:hypothetical protein